MKRLFLATLGVLLLAGTLQAQVAVPSLVPSRPDVLDPGWLPLDASFTPENPAAMQWGAPSQVGYGVINAKVRDPNFPGEADEFKGSYGGFRWVGERFAIAAEEVSLKDSEPFFDIAQKESSVALSLRYDDNLAFGFESGETQRGVFFPGGPPPPPSEEEITLGRQTLGVSFRLWEYLFLGLAQTRETGTFDHIQPGPPFKQDLNRVIEKYGLGVRAGSMVQVHAEYFVVSKEPFKDPGGKRREEEREVAVLELKVWNFLVGVRNTTVRHLRGRSPGFENKLKYDIQGVDYGWAPNDGLSIMVHASKTKRKEDDFDSTRPPGLELQQFKKEAESLSMSVSWLF